LKKGKELFVGLIFIIGIIIIFTCPLNSSPLKGFGFTKRNRRRGGYCLDSIAFRFRENIPTRFLKPCRRGVKPCRGLD
jgi:hypothetical protein